MVDNTANPSGFFLSFFLSIAEWASQKKMHQESVLPLWTLSVYVQTSREWAQTEEAVPALRSQSAVAQKSIMSAPPPRKWEHCPNTLISH